VGAKFPSKRSRIGSPSHPNAGCTPTNTLPSCAPITNSDCPSVSCLPGAAPHVRSTSASHGSRATCRSALTRACTLAGAPKRSRLPSHTIARSASTLAGNSTVYPCSASAASVRCSDGKTLRYAALPVLPALGGKLKSTTASLRSARGVRRRPHHRRHAVGHRLDALGHRLARRRRPLRGAGAAPAVHRGRHRAVELGDRHLERRLQRVEPARVGAPRVHALELERLERQVRHVDGGEHGARRRGVVVGRARRRARSRSG
jgi:hypothetical protein